MPKWCWNWPHCRCGINLARDLESQDRKMMIWRDGAGDIKRVPVSELLTLAIVEMDIMEQTASGCPETDRTLKAE